jgi:hypothetical protein
MKKIGLVICLLLVATECMAAFTYMSFRPYSSAGSVCTVVPGDFVRAGTTVPVLIPNNSKIKILAFSRGRTPQFLNYSTSTIANQAISVSCVTTAGSGSPLVTNMFFEGIVSTFYPISSAVFGIR